jgi:3,4-dihydroxy 2-butanone 4-phosphate synthase/GTP cyclohydrolase II
MTDESPFEIEYSGIDEAISAIQAGQAIIVVDAQDRENEGDFICSAELITPETVDFMLRMGRGMLCVPLIEEVADRLQLAPAVNEIATRHPSGPTS